jgi:hypothetical protein
MSTSGLSHFQLKVGRIFQQRRVKARDLRHPFASDRLQIAYHADGGVKHGEDLCFSLRPLPWIKLGSANWFGPEVDGRGGTEGHKEANSAAGIVVGAETVPLSADEAKQLLVVAPTGLLENWRAEHDRHLSTPGLGHCVQAYGRTLANIRKASADV